MKQIEGMWDLSITSTTMPRFTFPTKERVQKLPTIVIEGERKRYLKWVVTHPEIEPWCQPVFTDFNLSTENYLIDCHYNGDLTELFVRVWIQGKTVLTAYTSKDKMDNIMFDFAALPTEYGRELYPPEGLKLLAGEAIVNALSVQIYLHQYEPEIVAKINSGKSEIQKIVLTEKDIPKEK